MRNKWVGASLIQVLMAFIVLSAVRGQALTDDPSIINDHLFHGSAAAQPFIDFDNKGFLVHGKRTFLVSAGIEYARMPHELWRDRLLRLKRGGFNCVEIYTIWNFHEPHEGQFEFSGDQDLDLFLNMVKELGMYAIVRVGPYYCAEWDQGGYPLWLRFKRNLRVREDNPEFIKYADRFFDHLMPVVVRHQINHGGAVVMVQLENEHPKGWGTIMPNNYFKHLQAKALSLGMEVPYLFSGVHHSTDPAGDGSLDDPSRPNPWFSTEFWSTWYTQYGAKPTDAALYARRTWKIIAHGGNGYNFYMAYGGSNFGYTNNDEDAASYDYGAAVGQAGDLRPIYFTFKRAAFFARSFQEILENSSDATEKYRKSVVINTVVKSDTVLRITARRSDAGDLIFLDNPGAQSGKTEITVDKGVPKTVIKLAPGEIYPIVHNFRIAPSVTLNWALTRVYGIIKQNNTTTLLLEAAGGEHIYADFLLDKKTAFKSVDGKLKITGNKVALDTKWASATKPAEYLFKAGRQTIRILVMDSRATDKTWLTETAGLQSIVTGVSYLGRVVSDQKQRGRKSISFEAETPLNVTDHGEQRFYLENGSILLQPDHPKVQPLLKAADTLIRMTKWETLKNPSVTAPDFDDKEWLQNADPLQMGADGDLTADAWYRAKFKTSTAGKYTLQVEGGDRGTAFLDGKLAAQWKIREGEVTMDMTAGEHTLAVFTAHEGRDKMAAYLGPIDNIDKKGLSGKVLLQKGGPFYKTLDQWFFVKGESAEDVKAGPPLLDTLKLKKYKIGDDAFGLKEGYGWFETVIPAQKGLSDLTVLFKSVDEDATVFVNGKEVMRQKGWNNPFQFTLKDPDVLSKPMTLAVFVENRDKEGGIDQVVKINTIGNAGLIKDWKMKGGPVGATDGPAFYKSTFSLPVVKGVHQIWRVNPLEMGHGSIWVNGHHLGRYPEKNGNIGLYIPEPWLKAGTNDLLIYDEDGKLPQHITLSTEKNAGRIVNIYH